MRTSLALTPAAFAVLLSRCRARRNAGLLHGYAPPEIDYARVLKAGAEWLAKKKAGREAKGRPAKAQYQKSTTSAEITSSAGPSCSCPAPGIHT